MQVASLSCLLSLSEAVLQFFPCLDDVVPEHEPDDSLTTTTKRFGVHQELLRIHLCHLNWHLTFSFVLWKNIWTMFAKLSLVSASLLSITFASATQAYAENWSATNRISIKREVKIQIDIDSITHSEENWIAFVQRLQDDSNRAFKPFKEEVNCIDKVFSSALSKDEREDQFRCNGRWIVDFPHKDDPRDIITVEISPSSDYYREKTFALICVNYKK